MSAPDSSRSPEVQAAYAFCRGVAKREAKNFYYAFRVLPRYKSDAMCAVYAFMRKADDLADDESLTVPERRDAMARWTAEWRASRMRPSADAVFLALDDTQLRFGISNELLEQLVAGTTMDLEESLPGVVEAHLTTITEGGRASGHYQVYETFADLYRYCYLVASVVGLVCIKIFGYSDPHAEVLAEQTGVAFQLTNILRDIAEDAQRGRIYLPLDDMAATNVELEHFVLAAEGMEPSSEVLSLVEKEIHRAREYYLASDELISLLDPDSREAMRVLATIYRKLLERIASDPVAVFRTRVSVPTSRKLFILGRGLFASWLSRGKA